MLVGEINTDNDLQLLIGREGIGQLPIWNAKKDVEAYKEWLTEVRDKGQGQYFTFFAVQHGSVRWLKSVSLIYLSHLQARRDSFARRQNSLRDVIDVLDRSLAEKREWLNSGPFANASPIPLLVADKPEDPSAPKSTASVDVVSEQLSMHPSSPPVLLSERTILDNELRSKCEDLLFQFTKARQFDRFDDIIAAATKILEVRVREAAGLPDGTHGSALMNAAFGPKAPKLRVSQHDGEQEGVLFLFRGVSQFLRNSSHHRPLGEIDPHRAFQITGLIDYLLSLVDSADKAPAPEE